MHLTDPCCRRLISIKKIKMPSPQDMIGMNSTVKGSSNRSGGSPTTAQVVCGMHIVNNRSKHAWLRSKAGSQYVVQNI